MQAPHESHDEDLKEEVPALAAIQLLVQDFPPARRKEVARRIYEILRDDYGRADPSVPNWLRKLKKRVDTEFP